MNEKQGNELYNLTLLFALIHLFLHITFVRIVNTYVMQLMQEIQNMTSIILLILPHLVTRTTNNQI